MIATVPVTRMQLDEIADLVRLELAGRPLQFRLSPDAMGLTIEAVVPTFYSKQLLLRAVQKVSSLPIQDRIAVPYPQRRENREQTTVAVE